MMENLKILVNGNKEIAKKAELYLSELGYHTSTLDRSNCYGWSILKNEGTYYSDESCFNDDAGRLITINQLKDMVVLKRNDVNDATHIDDYNDKWLVNSLGSFNWCDANWTDKTIDVLGYALKPIEKKTTETEYLMQGKNGERLMESVGQLKDNVNQPNHYTSGGIECLDAMQAMLSRDEFIGFLRGNVFKYNWRYKLKNGIEDLKKAQFYQNKLIELESDDAI